VGTSYHTLQDDDKREARKMPLARIDLIKGKSSEYKRAIADGVYRALVEAVGAPGTISSASSQSMSLRIWSTIPPT
jgi:hypothetical protein